MESHGKDLNLAIVSPMKEAISESFIAAHRNYLPFKIHYYYGGTMPKFYGKKNLSKASIVGQIAHLMKRKLTNRREGLLSSNLKKSLIKNNIHVVLAEYGTTGATICHICKELNIPLITHFHGFDASVHEVLHDNKEAYEKLFAYASGIVSVSSVMSDKLKSLGCTSDKIIYCPYGPHDEFYNVTPAYQSFNFISLGRFVDKKAPYYTILAFDKVQRSFPSAKLIMGGDGPLLNMCKNIVKYLGLTAKVEFPGILSRDSFIRHLNNSFCYVQHSITADNGDMEGTPVSILEASAAGLPIISTLHAGIPDVVLNQETGLLIDEHDVIGMVEKMTYVMHNKEVSKRMGEKGKEHIRKNFPISKHINTLKAEIMKAHREKLRT